MDKNNDRCALRYDESINDLTAAALAEMKRDVRSALESFDAYIDKLKAKVHSEANEYRSRCARGYLLLLDEISREMRSKKSG